MLISTDFNMLHLEAPCNLLQITDGTRSMEHVEIASPATWVRCQVRHQTQAERDLRQLYEVCSNKFDRSDAQMAAIERAYVELLEGACYLCEQTQNQVQISKDWIRMELATTANAYQTFSQKVWESISVQASDIGLRQIHQGTQLARLHDALAFQAEANIARSQHLAKFQGDVTNWVSQHNDRMAALEEALQGAWDEIRNARMEIQLRTAGAPLPTSRVPTPSFLQGPAPATGGGSRGGIPPRRPRPRAMGSPSPSPPPFLPQPRQTMTTSTSTSHARTDGQPPPNHQLGKSGQTSLPV